MPTRLAVGAKRDLLDFFLGVFQQIVAAFFQRFAACVDRDRFLKLDIAFLQPLDNRFQFLHRGLEAQRTDIVVLIGAHIWLASEREEGSVDFKYERFGLETIRAAADFLDGRAHASVAGQDAVRQSDEMGIRRGGWGGSPQLLRE